MNAAPTPADAAADQAWMQQALYEAERAIGLTDPNPRVGCILVDPSGREIARGHTQEAGGAHAEVMALRAAHAAGRPLAGATVYVTLEPCAHHGRTPPCVDALIAAGVGRVVVALEDPNPQVAGKGLAALRAHGIPVHSGVLADAARELNLGFFSRMLRGRPWVRVKAAASLDGRTALDDGRSQWITGEAARTDGHAWRRRAGALLTGLGTVQQDNPRLDVRLVPTARQPLRVVLDSRLAIAPSARILAGPGAALVYTCAAPAPRGAQVEVVRLPADATGRVDLAAVLHDLTGRGINELHVEAGQRLNGAWQRSGWIDEWLLYLAPKLIGAGRGIVDLGPLAQLELAPTLEIIDLQRLGPDLRVRARPPGRASF